MCSATGYVRFVPIADIRHLFDHLVGATLYRLWHGNAERLGGLEVDHQLDFRCLLDWQVRRLLALEDSAGIDASQTIDIPFHRLRSSSGRRPRRTGDTGRLPAPRGGGIARQAARLWVLKNVSGLIKSAPARSWTKVAKALSKSRSALAFRIGASTRGRGPPAAELQERFSKSDRSG